MSSANKVTWLGRGMSALAVLPFLFSMSMKFSANPQMLEGFSHLGWPESMIMGIAGLELMSVVIYAIPQLSILGAILLTGYLGGAIATHLRVGESPIVQVFIGLLVWGGLYFREPRLRAILPIRKSTG